MSAAFSVSGPDIANELEASGLTVFASLRFAAEEGPLLDDQTSALSLLLIGNAGGAMWPVFSSWLSTRDECPEPLDSWSKEIIGPVADRHGGTAFYPSDPPYQPFQQWAATALGLRPSPLGILMHPQYGLWFGFRGAIAFRQDLAVLANQVGTHACDSCIEKPCLTSCPVRAVAEDGFSFVECHHYLVEDQGQAGCMQTGCLARNACPVGDSHRYPEGQVRFHMRALNLPSG